MSSKHNYKDNVNRQQEFLNDCLSYIQLGLIERDNLTINY